MRANPRQAIFLLFKSHFILNTYPNIDTLLKIDLKRKKIINFFIFLRYQ